MRRDKTERQKMVERQIEFVRQNQWKYQFLEGIIRHASVPLLIQTPRGNSFELIASGVLKKIAGHVFLFTAGHALETLRGHDIFIPVRDGRILPIGGSAYGSRALDAGILHLENPDLTPFLDIALPAGMVFAQSNILEDRLVLSGYPARNFRRKGKNASCDPGIYEVKGKPESAYRRVDRDPAKHILMEWNKKIHAPQGVVRSPSLAAMSGCGVWFVPPITSRPLSIHAPGPLPRLMGIFTEQRRRDAMLVATNVDVHVRVVWEAYPQILDLYAETYKALVKERSEAEAPTRPQSTGLMDVGTPLDSQ
jgi:hypothetical protein